MALGKSIGKRGKIAEDFAANLLLSKGYKILERNFRSKFGEIDIIAKEGGSLVFVEVKARWSKNFGSPEDAVTPQKLYKIQKTAEYFSLLHKGLPVKERIEVVALEIEGSKVVSSKIIAVD
jgi:putative endonuclease